VPAVSLYSCRKSPRGPPAKVPLEGRYSSYRRIPPLIHAVERLISRAREAVVLTLNLPTSFPNRTGEACNGNLSKT
jgi:hypothetical protein